MQKFVTHSPETFFDDLKKHGSAAACSRLCSHLTPRDGKDLLTPEHLGRFYEIALAAQDKKTKKKRGKYYTPSDVAAVMCRWFDRLPGTNICDVGCGTGQLILTYLALIGKKRARRLVRTGHLYLYDSDPIALEICKTAITTLYGDDLAEHIRTVHADFLDRDVHLPADCKTISNPPYSAVNTFPPTWEQTPILCAAREHYAAFMEKILGASRSAVIITPYSFVSGKKFFPLRLLLNDRCGEIYTFDNVPGNIFRGKKQGIFNSNTSNSVRAAITVCRTAKRQRGFRVTPLIRFKSEERAALLRCEVLESFLPEERQIVSPEQPMLCKSFRELRPVHEKWLALSGNETFSELTARKGTFTLAIPNTCRYYTSALDRPLNRKGQILLPFDDKGKFRYAYCLINSSFAYWHWRMYDGGITYPRNLLMNMPVFYDVLTAADKAFFKRTAEAMIRLTPEYMITKRNVGVQENVKFPAFWREKINKRFLKILGCDVSEKVFDPIHANRAFPEETW
jgi:SAM-dependent methyltransferase